MGNSKAITLRRNYSVHIQDPFIMFLLQRCRGRTSYFSIKTLGNSTNSDEYFDFIRFSIFIFHRRLYVSFNPFPLMC